jgi:PAS domain S-box-containing protein
MEDKDKTNEHLIEELLDLRKQLAECEASKDKHEFHKDFPLSDDIFRFFVENANDIIFALTPDGILTYASPNWTEILGHDIHKVVGQPIDDFIHPEDIHLCRAFMERVITTGKKQAGVEYRVRHKTGAWRWHTTNASPVRDIDGNTVSYMGIARDITERKRAEEELKFKNLLLTTQQEVSIDGILIVDSEGRIISFNKRFVDMWGIPPEVVESRSDDGIFQTILFKLADSTPFLEKVRHLEKNSHETSSDEIGLIDGRTFERYSAPMERADGLNYGRVWFFHDITQSRWAEEAIHQSEEKFRTLFMSLNEGFYLSEVICDDNGNPCDYRYLEVNPKFEQILGLSRDQIIGKRYREIVPVDTTQWLDNYFKVARSGEPCTFVFYSNEYHMYFETYAYQPTKGQVSVFVRNITERKKLEEQLNQAQKMEAVGQLAGGIAHDFNNILAAIIGYTEIAKRKLQQRELHHYLEQILRAGDRAKNLVSQILAFSRKTDKEINPVDVTSLIKEILKLLRATLPSTIEIRPDIDSRAGEVFADPTQLHQVMMNLCTNAAHAMREKGGVLGVGLSSMRITPEILPLYPDLKLGPYLKLMVCDTGTGIAPDIMDRIFDPFFTTKKKGEGTGLGLSVVYGIVKECGGTVTVQSKPGKGSTFNIYLPAIEHAAESSGEPAFTIPGGKERVIFVDDEDILAEMGREILEGLGYEIIAETSAARALEIFRAQPDRFDLVITDMTMPGMTGKQLAAELLGIRPDIPIILCTGFSEIITEEEAKLMGIREFAIKPLNIRSISELIRKALNQKGS